MEKVDITNIVESLHPLELKILFAFEAGKGIEDAGLIKEAAIEQSQKDMAIGWLLAKGVVKVTSEKTDRFVVLTETGENYKENRIPELRIYQAIKDNPEVTMAEIRGRSDLDPSEISSAVGALKDKGIIRIAAGGRFEINNQRDKNVPPIQNTYPDRRGFPTPPESSSGESLVSEFEAIQQLIVNVGIRGEVDIAELPENEQRVIEGLHRKRGKTKGIFRINETVIRTYALTDTGVEVHSEVIKRGKPKEEISQLTPEMLKDGTWKGKTFRKYNISLPPPRVAAGRKHPYKEFLDTVKNKLVAMGFQEMRGGLVENEFWNMDALYMPQFHPARDIHDAYYLKDPKTSKSIEEPYLSNVSEAHLSGGGTGSRGWKYSFNVEKAKRLMLRSQGTAVSARTLASNPKIPGKYFSIARCFRYEQVDATHAQDFFQIEGIVIGEDINFSTLLGLLKLFAIEVAKAKEIDFLPAYFPFTEPSVELHVKHPKLGWMELGGAGIFRPEVTIPLGVDVPVIAWGLGLDRMAMVALEIHDIRDLFSANLDMIRTKRTCML
ncbi:MAG: phenylalanine--tRNA ligase subunit alpha [Nitrospirae bacterium]|nr:phenylalanine--tRNA ligase subunit alpha [Nitrospirota bacterium]